MRDLDREVAEKVMGEHWCREDYEQCATEGPCDVPCSAYIARYSTSIADAWLVVEAMREKGWWMYCELSDKGAWVGYTTFGGISKGDPPGVLASTMPEAICRAALTALWRREDGHELAPCSRR